MVLHLNNEEIEQILTINDCIEVLEKAFVDLSKGLAVNRPRSHSYIPLEDNKFYLFKSMDGGLPGLGVHALRISSDILAEPKVAGGLRREKLPSIQGKYWLGLVFLFDIYTGMLIAIMQDGYLQRMRVGATSALAAKVLSRPESKTVGLIGSGWQAGAQLMGIKQVRNVETIKVYSPSPEKRTRFVQEMRSLLGMNIVEAGSPETVVNGADILIAATNSLQPVFSGEWLEPGMHVNSIQGRELDDETVKRADLIAVRAREEPRHWVMGTGEPGEMKHAKILTEGDKQKLCELGDLLSGKVQGRVSERQITLFTGGGTGGSAGLGIQFAAVAAKVYELALAKGIGRCIPDELFLESVHP